MRARNVHEAADFGSRAVSVYVCSMLTIHFARHGETQQAAQGSFAGDIDPPLTVTGVTQAVAVGRAATALSPVAIYVSPKLRARMTAEPAARACNLEPIVDEGLREIAYGSWEGRNEAEVLASEPEAFKAWSQDPALHSPPGGENAFAVAARAVPVLLRIMREHPSGHVLVVSHKATIRIVVCALLDVPLGRFRDRFDCPPASITTLELHERGALLTGLADVRHLDGAH
jgi:probable phosphoglycerate mutase